MTRGTEDGIQIAPGPNRIISRVVIERIPRPSAGTASDAHGKRQTKSPWWSRSMQGFETRGFGPPDQYSCTVHVKAASLGRKSVRRKLPANYACSRIVQVISGGLLSFLDVYVSIIPLSCISGFRCVDKRYERNVCSVVMKMDFSIVCSVLLNGFRHCFYYNVNVWN